MKSETLTLSHHRIDDTERCHLCFEVGGGDSKASVSSDKRRRIGRQNRHSIDFSESVGAASYDCGVAPKDGEQKTKVGATLSHHKNEDDTERCRLFSISK